MSPAVFHRPIIPLLLSMIIGILIGTWIPGKTAWAFLLLAVGSGGLLLDIKKKSSCLAAPILLFISMGYLLIQPWASPRFSSNHIVHFQNIRDVKIEGVIEQIDRMKDDRVRFVMQTSSIHRNGRIMQTNGRIRVTAFGGNLAIEAGDRIAFAGKIRPFRNFNNPGGFDYKRYMMFKRIWGTSYIPSKRITVLKEAAMGGLRKWIENTRLDISRFIAQQTPERATGVLTALLVGDRSHIPADIKAGFHRSGTGHILAISGLHIGIIASVSFFMFRRFLVYVKPMLWRAWCGKGAALLSLLPVWGYGMLAGMSPSTLRAVIMVSIFLTALLLERDQDSINTLAIAAFCILVIDPTALLSISFQLSFAAVFAILLGHALNVAVRGEKENRLFNRFQRKFVSFVLVSIFAIIGTLPLVMRYFNEVSLVGFLGNLIAIPFIGFGVVPLGLLSVCLHPFSLTAAAVCIKAASTVLLLAAHLMTFLSARSFAAVHTLTPSILETICYYTILAALYGMLKTREARRKRAMRIIIVALTILIADAGYWVQHRFLHTDLRITAIDVGQGSATLLELPRGNTVLIDGGGFSDRTIFDMGARVIAPMLWRKKILTIDTIILTHPNSDHLNGLLYIAEHFTVKSIWTNGEPEQSKEYADFQRIIAERHIPAPEFQQLPRIQEVHNIQIMLLYPPLDFMHRKKFERWRVVNNNSLVLKVRYGDVSFLFPGDIMNRAEKEIVAEKGAGLGSTVLFSPHHGSRSSSSADFLDAVSPEIVVISTGWRNRFGSPHPSILKRYQERGCRIYNTALNGAINIFTDGRTLQVKPYLRD